jgi:magnesium transporter
MIRLLRNSQQLEKRVGQAPGVEHDEIVALSRGSELVPITCTDYSPTDLKTQEVDDLDEFLSCHRPEWSAVRWINVAGLSDMRVVHALATKYELHPLAIEDLLHLTQRPKVEPYGGDDSKTRARLFIVVRMLQMKEERLQSEQISMFVGHTTVLTFEEHAGDVWDPIRLRISTKGSRLRGNNASFLMYSLLDAVVDHCFPILEHYGERLEELEDVVLDCPPRETINEIHEIKRDLLLLRRSVWPMREVVSTLQREPHECMSEDTRVYLRDLYDHVVQIIDILETYREMATGLAETYMSAVSNRMNEIMKVLTIMGTIFIPLTFLAGVYGMNFQHIPELSLKWAYPAFWGICVLLAGLLLWVFKRRGWL